ncbi:hypothetical protein LXL04_009212 [Taraxacum kok-saghyz]
MGQINITRITIPFHSDHPYRAIPPTPASIFTSLDLHQLLSTLARFDSISNAAKSAACTASKMVGFPSLYLPIFSLWKSIRNQLKLGFVLQLDRILPFRFVCSTWKKVTKGTVMFDLRSSTSNPSTDPDIRSCVYVFGHPILNQVSPKFLNVTIGGCNG